MIYIYNIWKPLPKYGTYCFRGLQCNMVRLVPFFSVVGVGLDRLRQQNASKWTTLDNFNYRHVFVWYVCMNDYYIYIYSVHMTICGMVICVCVLLSSIPCGNSYWEFRKIPSELMCPSVNGQFTQVIPWKILIVVGLSGCLSYITICSP